MSYDMPMGGASRTITAFFDSRADADRAVESLVSAGVGRSSVRVVAGSEGGHAGSSTLAGDNDLGFWESLKDLFMADEDRHTYAEGLRRGGYLVTVSATDDNYDTALDILDDEGTVDISERETSWRSEGWSGDYAGASSSGVTGLARESTVGGWAGSSTERRDVTTGVGSEEVIPVVEEQLRVGKRDVSHGRVRVRSYVVETPVSEQVSLREESIHVERRPVDRALTGNENLFQERTIEVEERSEEAVIAKDARVTEELVINKDVGQRTQTVSDTVRRTEVEVEDERGRTVEGGLKTSRPR